MARIAGVNIPTNKRVTIGLRYIYGIGPTKAAEICGKLAIPDDRRVNQLSDEEVLRIREMIDRDYRVEGDLRREVAMNIKRLMDLGCYRGLRHRRGLAVIGLESCHHSFPIVVGPAGELVRAAHVADTSDGGGLERVMVAGAALRAGEASSDSRHQGRVIHREFDHGIERHPLLGQQSVQRLGLGHRAREPIEDEALRRIRLLHALSQHAGYDVVGNQLTGLHHRLRLTPDR